MPQVIDGLCVAIGSSHPKTLRSPAMCLPPALGWERAKSSDGAPSLLPISGRVSEAREGAGVRQMAACLGRVLRETPLNGRPYECEEN